MSTNLIEEAQGKGKAITKEELVDNTVSKNVSQNVSNADINLRDKTVLKSVRESLTAITEELRVAAAKLAGNVDQTTLDRLDVVEQQLDSIK